MSPEDIIPVFGGVFVGSSDERRTHQMKTIGAEATPWGSLFAIWNVDTPGQVGWFILWLVSCLLDWFVGWLVGLRWVGWLVMVWLVGWLVV